MKKLLLISLLSLITSYCNQEKLAKKSCLNSNNALNQNIIFQNLTLNINYQPHLFNNLINFKNEINQPIIHPLNLMPKSLFYNTENSIFPALNYFDSNNFYKNNTKIQNFNFQDTGINVKKNAHVGDVNQPIENSNKNNFTIENVTNKIVGCNIFPFPFLVGFKLKEIKNDLSKLYFWKKNLYLGGPPFPFTLFKIVFFSNKTIEIFSDLVFQNYGIKIKDRAIISMLISNIFTDCMNNHQVQLIEKDEDNNYLAFDTQMKDNYDLKIFGILFKNKNLDLLQTKKKFKWKKNIYLPDVNKYKIFFIDENFIERRFKIHCNKTDFIPNDLIYIQRSHNLPEISKNEWEIVFENTFNNYSHEKRIKTNCINKHNWHLPFSFEDDFHLIPKMITKNNESKIDLLIKNVIESYNYVISKTNYKIIPGIVIYGKNRQSYGLLPINFNFDNKNYIWILVLNSFYKPSRLVGPKSVLNFLIPFSNKFTLVNDITYLLGKEWEKILNNS